MCMFVVLHNIMALGTIKDYVLKSSTRYLQFEGLGLSMILAPEMSMN